MEELMTDLILGAFVCSSPPIDEYVHLERRLLKPGERLPLTKHCSTDLLYQNRASQAICEAAPSAIITLINRVDLAIEIDFFIKVFGWRVKQHFEVADYLNLNFFLALAPRHSFYYYSADYCCQK